MDEKHDSTKFLLGDLTQTKLRQLIWWLVGSVIILWIVSAIVIYLSLDSWPNSGTFGDTFGCINALFSGLAFGGVVLAIILQSKELEYQREELQETRKEIRGQKEQLEAQNKTLTVQNFENTFFQMLRLHHEIVNAITKEIGRRDNILIKKGRDIFVDFYNELKSKYGEIQGSNEEQKYNEEQKINRAYVEIFAKHQSDIGHYFRNLYNIIKFIDKRGPTDFDEKYFYTSVVRAQLSSHELLLLFYNCLSQFGKDKFKPLIERYCLLKNMPLGQIIQKNHETFYEPSAYKKHEKNQ